MPGSVTEGESFLWYSPIPRLQLGIAYLWKQNAFRVLGNYEVIPETDTTPNLRVGVGLQEIGTGNPGYFATTEKHFHLNEGTVAAYVGIGARSNESHLHGLLGAKFTPAGTRTTFGVQADGHQLNWILSQGVGGGFTVGAYLIDGKKPGVLLSWAK